MHRESYTKESCQGYSAKSALCFTVYEIQLTHHLWGTYRLVQKCCHEAWHR